jgi:magnesium-transporting ATPase (P-type)
MGRSFSARKFGTHVLLFAAVTALTTVMITTVAYLSDRFHMSHFPTDMHLKIPSPATPNPYSIPSKIMTYVSFLLPLVVTSVLSARYFRKAEGSPGIRYLKALGLTCSSVPLMALQYLPWTIYLTIRTPGYLRYDDMSFLGVWVALYCVVLAPLSLGFNAVLWLTERFRAAPSK